MSRSRKKTPRTTGRGIIAIFLVMIFGIGDAYINNQYVRMSFKKPLESTKISSAAYVFEELEKLRKDIISMKIPAFQRFFNGEASWRKEMRQIFYKKFKPLLEMYVYNKELLPALQNHGRLLSNAAKRQEILDNLRAYLLLGRRFEDKLLQEKREQRFLKSHLKNLANRNFLREYPLSARAHSHLGQIRGWVHQQIDFFVDMMITENLQPFQSNALLVKQVRESLQMPVGIERLYSQLKYGLEVSEAPFTLYEALKGRNVHYFESNYVVPAMFRKRSWEMIIKEAIHELSKNPVTDNWVLGKIAEDMSHYLGDYALIKKKLEAQYFQEYVEHWRQFLQHITLKRFTGLNSVVKCFEMLGSDPRHSPLVRFLKAVAEQILLEDAPLKHNGAAENRNIEIKKSANPLQQEFRSMTRFHQDDLLRHPGLNSILREFSRVANELKMLSKRERPIEIYTARVLNKKLGALPAALKRIRQSLDSLDADIRENLFEKPLIMAWESVLELTRRNLNERWYEDVYQPFKQELADYYPFNKSGEDLPLEKFIHFFKNNGGTLQQFIDQQLGRFFDVKQHHLPAKHWEGKGLDLSEAFRKALRKAENIRRGMKMTPRGSMGIHFSIVADLPEPGNMITQSILSINGETVDYRMKEAPSERHFSWPGEKSISGASLEYLTVTGAYASLGVWEGQWGLFRLTDQAVIEKKSGSELLLQFQIPGEKPLQWIMHYHLRMKSSLNPFQDKNFFNFDCPGSLN